MLFRSECMVKESAEEASIEPSYVRGFARGAGVLSYFYRLVVCFFWFFFGMRLLIFFRSDKGWLQPEVQCVNICQVKNI